MGANHKVAPEKICGALLEMGPRWMCGIVTCGRNTKTPVGELLCMLLLLAHTHRVTHTHDHRVRHTHDTSQHTHTATAHIFLFFRHRADSGTQSQSEQCTTLQTDLYE